ncbi:TRAP transporter small permease subunit [Mesorhizobium sp. KR1-2]|uniref:TRAP transporter small permease subunit n=1 Tax=Mesorhizobium sp. KR1-2 TaxID=3156609 RepID=UPI0032B51B14
MSVATQTEPAGNRPTAGAAALYVRYVDALNHRVGRFAMYLIFPMAAILLYATISRAVFGIPVNWVLETSQFILSAYYLLGGAYSKQLDAHVRMDLFYGRLSPRNKAMTDAFTILFVLFYLAILFTGGLSSTHYAISFGQKNYSSWAPPLWPVKVLMTTGIFLMLLQSISSLIKDIAIVRGKPIA